MLATPRSEYLEFRDELGSSSGFQSYQNRQIEFALGFKNARTLSVYAHDETLYPLLEASLHAPSIYDVTVREMHRRGLPSIFRPRARCDTRLGME